jgi:hypothetical protein
LGIHRLISRQRCVELGAGFGHDVDPPVARLV